jgi:hypothetical protein
VPGATFGHTGVSGGYVNYVAIPSWGGIFAARAGSR